MSLSRKPDDPVEDTVENDTDAVDFVAETGAEAEDAALVGEVDGRQVSRRRFVFVVMPALVVALAALVGLLRWEQVSMSQATIDDAVRAASDGAVAMLSYKPSTVEQDLSKAQSLLAGSFRDEYAKMARDTVVPGSRKRQVSAVATVPAAGSVSITGSRATVLVFVNQAIIIGDGAPTNTHSSVRVTLDKVGDRWLIAGFDPV